MNSGPFSRDDLIVGVLALLLLIDLLFLAWFSVSATVSVGNSSFTFGGTLTATQDPDGWTAIIACLASLAVIVDLAIERLSPGTTLPNIGGSRTRTRFVLACVAVGFLVLKFLFNIHFSYFGLGFYLAVVLSAGLIWATYQADKASAVY